MLLAFSSVHSSYAGEQLQEEGLNGVIADLTVDG